MKTNKLFTSLALGLLLVGCASNEEPSKPINQIEIPTVEQEPQEEVKPIERKVLELNTPIITTYDGVNDFELQITEVRFTNDRNEYYDGVPVENVIVIKVQATNIGSEPHFLSDSKFNVYDSEGNLLDLYPTTDTQYSDIEEVNVGRKATIEVAYGIPQGTEFEIEVVDQITGDIIGSLYFEGVGQAEDDEIVEEEQEVKNDEQIVQTDNEVIINSPLTFEQYIEYFCDNTEQAFEEYFTLIFNSSIDGKTHKMITSDNVVLWSATSGESGASWLEGQELQEQDVEVFGKIQKALSELNN